MSVPDRFLLRRNAGGCVRSSGRGAIRAGNWRCAYRAAVRRGGSRRLTSAYVGAGPRPASEEPVHVPATRSVMGGCRVRGNGRCRAGRSARTYCPEAHRLRHSIADHLGLPPSPTGLRLFRLRHGPRTARSRTWCAPRPSTRNRHRATSDTAVRMNHSTTSTAAAPRSGGSSVRTTISPAPASTGEPEFQEVFELGVLVAVGGADGDGQPGTLGR